MKNIVLLSDGTGNSAAKLFKTNVWRIYQALELHPQSGQIAFYDDGVGTSAFRPLALLGGAFGVGLKRNVRNLYTFLCRNYDEGDRIYAFGFSRGAYTIRVLAGMIACQGLVAARGMHEDELLAAVNAAYASDRKDYKARWRLDRTKTATAVAPVVPEGRIAARIAFLGLWDTVDAYGMPIDEMKRGIDYWLLGLGFPDQDLSPQVELACHALALDDERRTFHPVLWNERYEAEHGLPPGRLKQVWFAGMHSNVGGGYAKDALSYVSLNWMLAQAQGAGLRFNGEALKEFAHLANAHGDMGDARAGLGAYYRYDPRDVAKLCNDDYNRVYIARPKIHHSVLDRIQRHQVPYSPHVLPETYDVVGPQGTLLDVNPYETRAQASQRMKHLERVWDLVWWRRVTYFATLFLTLLLAAFPLLPWVPKTGECTGPWCFLAPLLAGIGAFLPDFAAPLTEAFGRNIGLFFTLAAGVAATMAFGKWLEWRILLRSSSATAHMSGRTPRPIPFGPLSRIARAFRTSPALVRVYLAFTRKVTPAIALVVSLLLLAVLANRLLYEIAEAAGATCRPAHKGQPTVFLTSELCHATGQEVVAGRSYAVRMEIQEPWTDASHPASPGGLTGSPEGARVHRSAVFWKRSWSAPWFQPMVRVGHYGRDRYPVRFRAVGEHIWMSDTFTARSDGQVFVFVNDAVVAIPFLAGAFYWNNRGSARVMVIPYAPLR